jgi:Holliday junction resolvase
MTPEAKVKASVVKLLKKYEVYYFFPATHGFGRSGVPDIICCANGVFLGVECKAGDNKPTELQLLEMKKIRDAGGKTLVVNEENISELEELLKELTNENRGNEQGRADIT